MKRRFISILITKIAVGISITSTLSCSARTSPVAMPTPVFPPISATAIKILGEEGQIVFSSEHDGSKEIYISEGENILRLTDNLGEYSDFPN